MSAAGTLVFPGQSLAQLRSGLLRGDVEHAAILLARPVTEGSFTRLLVRDMRTLSPDEYLAQDALRATIAPQVVAEMASRARSEQCSMVFVHSHVAGVTAAFSSVDDGGEAQLGAFLVRRNIPGPHAALVVSEDGVAARVLGSVTPLEVIQVGPTVEGSQLAGPKGSLLEAHDRQVRAFGADGQRRLSNLRVGIVGLGGTGSIVAQQLAHLGVRNFVLVDCDSVDATSLNRLVGATGRDVGAQKVEIARRSIGAIGFPQEENITPIVGNVMDASVARQLLSLDAIFCCTDSHGSRAVLNQIAYQFVIPVFDVGVVIAADAGRVVRIAGRSQMLAPGLGCLLCAETLDSKQIRLDFMSTEEKAKDPYFEGDGTPQPAVISLNSTVSSLAVTMFLSAFVGVPASARLQLYDAQRGIIRSAEISRVPACIVCSATGALARGTEWPLPTRNA